MSSKCKEVEEVLLKMQQQLITSVWNQDKLRLSLSKIIKSHGPKGKRPYLKSSPLWRNELPPPLETGGCKQIYWYWGWRSVSSTNIKPALYSKIEMKNALLSPSLHKSIVVQKSLTLALVNFLDIFSRIINNEAHHSVISPHKHMSREMYLMFRTECYELR